MTLNRERLERWLAGGLGWAGAGLAARFAWLWWQVLSSPGDDNPIALAYLAGLALSGLPGLGLAFWLRGKPLGPWGWLWALVALPVTGLLAFVGWGMF